MRGRGVSAEVVCHEAGEGPNERQGEPRPKKDSGDFEQGEGETSEVVRGGQHQFKHGGSVGLLVSLSTLYILLNVRPVVNIINPTLQR